MRLGSCAGAVSASKKLENYVFINDAGLPPWSATEMRVGHRVHQPMSCNCLWVLPSQRLCEASCARAVAHGAARECQMQILRRRAAPLIPDDPLNPSMKRVSYEEQEAAEEAALRAAAPGELPPPPPPPLPPPADQPEASQSEPSDSRSKRKRPRSRGKGGNKAAPTTGTAATAADARADSATTASNAASAQQRLSRAVRLTSSVPLAELATQPLDGAQLAAAPPLPVDPAAQKEPADKPTAPAPQQATATTAKVHVFFF
jgi:hypothetical protein